MKKVKRVETVKKAGKAPKVKKGGQGEELRRRGERGGGEGHECEGVKKEKKVGEECAEEGEAEVDWKQSGEEAGQTR